MRNGNRRDSSLETGEKLALITIVVFHLAGVILLSFSRGQLYRIALDFVPINLILTSLIIVKFQQEFNARFWQFLIFTFLTGLIIEIFGVNSGLVFGHYRYGEVLGPGFLGTPLLIGLNWFMVAYSVLCACDYLPATTWFRTVAGVLLMVGLDYLMEPVAMRLDFWQWDNGNIPLRNYAGWAGTSSAIMVHAALYPFKRKNRVAAWAFAIQVFFFLLMNIL
jgi:uncharacterized membrane protein